MIPRLKGERDRDGGGGGGEGEGRGGVGEPVSLSAATVCGAAVANAQPIQTCSLKPKWLELK